jgi:hypothetical protein
MSKKIDGQMRSKYTLEFKMQLAHLRAQLARVTMQRNILKKVTAYSR